jgi:hypothetical protein
MSEEYAKNLGKKVGEASYSGPMGLEGASQLGSRAASLAGMGDLARSGSMGQGLLLQDIAGRRSPYTRGQTALDTMLLGQSKEAQKSIKEGAGQTYGAKQQAETLASSAETQAKQAKDYIKEERSRILGEAAKSAEGIEKYGKEQADAYIKGVTRLKELMDKAGEVDPQTGDPLIDPDDLDDYDRDLLNRAEEYGFDATGTFVDPRERYSKLSKDILKGITADISTGGLKLTEPQKSALKNLSLLQQQESPQISEFITDRFGDAGTAQISALQAEQKQAMDEKTQALNKYIWSNVLPLGAHGDRTYNPSKNYEQIYENFRSRPFTGSGGQGYVMLPEQFAFHDKKIAPYKQNIENEALAQKGITIGDYLKSLYKINTPQGGQS